MAGSGRAAAALAGLLGLLVIACIIIQGQKPSTRPTSLKPTVLLEGEGPAVEAEARLAGRVHAYEEQRGAGGLAAAAKLLEQARQGYAEDIRKEESLIRSARRGDSTLGSPAQIARNVRSEVRRAFQHKYSGQSLSSETARQDASKGASLHMTIGWPQAGGVMPTDFAEPSTWGQHDDYYYPQQAQASWGSSGDWSPPDGGDNMDVGVVEGGPKIYANGFDDDSKDSNHGDDAGSSSSWNPFDWFVRGARSGQGRDRRVEWDMPQNGRDYNQWSSPDGIQDPIKKLIAIKKQRERLDKSEADTASSVYSAMTRGQRFSGDSTEEVAFMNGFLKGAVEASKKSVEQQGAFAKQLEEQGNLVNELESIVRALEDDLRKTNWGKTEKSINEAENKPAATPAAQEPAVAATPAAPVVLNLEFYMEALCPACRTFATTVLPQILNALESHVNLTTVPFGNAEVVNGTIACQHGPDECQGNRIELCMMDRKPNWKDWFPAFKCIEGSKHYPYNASKECLPKYGFDVDDVLKCANGDEGELLHLNAAKQTLGLNPHHEWTPWIVLNGSPVKHVNGLMAKMCEMLPKEQTENVQACNPKYADTKKEVLTSFEERRGYCYPHKPLLP